MWDNLAIKESWVDVAGDVICFIWMCFMFIPLAHQIWKTLKAISNQSNVSSKHGVEPESVKSNDNDILNLLSMIWNMTLSFQTVLYNFHAPSLMAVRKRGVTFQISFRKGGLYCFSIFYCFYYCLLPLFKLSSILKGMQWK